MRSRVRVPLLRPKKMIMKSKITIIGAGSVGSQTAFCAALKKLGDIVLIDTVPGLAEGRALDILQSLPNAGIDAKVAGGTDYTITAGSDIVVITAGVARRPGMTRDDLVNINSGIIKSVVPEAVKYSPNCILIMVTNPLDNMAHLAYKLAGLPKNRVIGMAGVLDSSRFRTFAAMETGESVKDIEAMVLGGHGDLMVPVLGSCKIKNIPVSQILSQEKLNKIVVRTQNGGGEIINLLKTGSTMFAPAFSIVEMIEAILTDAKKILPCSVLLSGEYGEKDVFAGVPVLLGETGAEKAVEIPLSPAEAQAFKKSVEHIRGITVNI